MKEIQLTKGFVAVVDDEDYERVSAYELFGEFAHCNFPE
jgi:hypothetical protein